MEPNKAIESGIEAEEKLLTLLREHKATYDDSEIKKQCMVLRSTYQSKQKDLSSCPLVDRALKDSRKRGMKPSVLKSTIRLCMSTAHC